MLKHAFKFAITLSRKRFYAESNLLLIYSMHYFPYRTILELHNEMQLRLVHGII